MIAVLLLVPLMFLTFSQSANILMMSTVCSPSHSLWYNKLAKLLVENGHQVTLMDSMDWGKHTPNLTRIVLDGAYVEPLSDLEQVVSDSSPYSALDLLYNVSTHSCRNQLLSSASKRFLRSIDDKQFKSIDLIIHDGINCECFLGFVHKLGYPPLISATAFSRGQGQLGFAGDTDNPSYVPAWMTTLAVPMSFYERVVNTLVHAYDRYAFSNYMKEQNNMAVQFFGEDLPPLEHIAKNTSLFLTNNHIVFDEVRPYTPAVIQVGGFHIDEPTMSLDKEVQDFLDGAEHGAIYFSLGTNILSSNMGETKRDMFLNAFRELPQRVLWKWEKDDIPNKPSNVLISKWFPQNQILGHPNIKLYISHGGSLGTQEAIYHGVPLVVIPFFIDQFSIAEKLVRKNVAINLKYSNLNKDMVKSAIETVINNQSYVANMKRLSSIFRDAPDTPQERVLYWINYVLRHKDLTHMRSPTVHMPLYQIFLIDVLLFIAGVIGIFLFLILATALKVKRLFFEGKKGYQKPKQS